MLWAMAAGDQFLFEVARRGLLPASPTPRRSSTGSGSWPTARQPAVVRELYDVAVEAVKAEKKV